MIATLIVHALLAAPTPGDLLLDFGARTAFVRTWSPSFVRVHFNMPTGPEIDTRFPQKRQTLGTIVTFSKEKTILAPTHRLRGVETVSIEFFDGSRQKATVEAPDNYDAIPFVKLQLKGKRPLERFKALSWSTMEKAPSVGLMLWAIEWPPGQQLPNSAAMPVLIRTSLGERVEPPLDRFFYAEIGRADGLALLTPSGEVQCLVFRSVPGIENKSLCAPESAALVADGKAK